MNFVSNIPLFLQVSDYFKHLIDVGAYKENEMLPSVREVANTYNINPNTVFKAYEILVKDGYIYSVYKKGFYVKKGIENNNQLFLKEKIEELLTANYSLSEIIEYCQSLQKEKNKK